MSGEDFTKMRWIGLPISVFLAFILIGIWAYNHHPASLIIGLALVFGWWIWGFISILYYEDKY
jgi:hypothetical protein